MATGNSGDSCRSCSSHDKTNVDTEQNKVEEVENTFWNNVYYRYQNEAEEDRANGVTMPGTPTVVDQLQIFSSSSVEIGHQLAIIGDELNRQKNREFQGMQVYLPCVFEHGYEFFCRVAERLFDNEVNWRQAITLLNFGYKSVRYICRRGIMESFSRVTEPVAKVVAKNQITQWIAERGGWATALSIENAILKWLFGIFVVAMLGVAVVCKIYKP